ncbi:MAG: CDP-alcohol phosphatidyltransferase family protein [Nitriliruptorales bacterium]|nr:CDP-alcohol phosphatidyltransferase family protein [Nitriliruptorales bacterium]
MRLFDIGARGEGSSVVHDRILTAANAITGMRLLGLPVFVWLMLGPQAYGSAFAVLVAVAATDWIDGYVARRFDQVTRLGQLLDPLIDRVLLATAAITLVVVGFLPLALAALFVGRDAVLLLVVLLRYRGIPPIPVSRIGKTATFFLLVGVPSFLLASMDWGGRDIALAVAWLFTVAGIVTYYIAGWGYYRAARTLAFAIPRTSGTSDD